MGASCAIVSSSEGLREGTLCAAGEFYVVLKCLYFVCLIRPFDHYKTGFKMLSCVHQPVTPYYGINEDAFYV